MGVEKQEQRAIRIHDLVKSYPGGGRPAVDGLNLEVGYGECFGLLGPNGAGKTTLISLLCTLLRPSTGQVQVCGFDVVAQAPRIRRVIGLVPQDIALYQSLTARENLRYFARMLKVAGGRIEARIEECLAMVGLLKEADRRIDTFSGGMKRRINLAVAVLHEPQLLFLDEPTVGIDAQSRNLILERLAELNRGGMTLIYTSHYMEEVEKLCSRVAIIDGGRIVASGAPQELVASAPGCQDLGQLFLELTGKQLRD